MVCNASYFTKISKRNGEEAKVSSDVIYRSSNGNEIN